MEPLLKHVNGMMNNYKQNLKRLYNKLNEDAKDYSNSKYCVLYYLLKIIKKTAKTIKTLNQME
jgi:hypothetical protein